MNYNSVAADAATLVKVGSQMREARSKVWVPAGASRAASPDTVDTLCRGGAPSAAIQSLIKIQVEYERIRVAALHHGPPRVRIDRHVDEVADLEVRRSVGPADHLSGPIVAQIYAMLHETVLHLAATRRRIADPVGSAPVATCPRRRNVAAERSRTSRA